MAENEDHPLARAAGGIAGAAVGATESIIGIVKHGVHEPPPDQPMRAEETYYEHSDGNMRAVFITGVLVLVCSHAFAWLLYLYLAYLQHHRTVTTNPPLPAYAHGYVLPPEPRLQNSPPLDLQAMFRAQHANQTHYHWLDRNKGIVAIPIDRAMEIVAQRGLSPEKATPGMDLPDPKHGTLLTGFEGKVEPEPR